MLTRNSKHIVLRSAMAFKKFGKEPFNRRTRYISFTINLLNLGHHAVVQTGGIYNQLNL